MPSGSVITIWSEALSTASLNFCKSSARVSAFDFSNNTNGAAKKLSQELVSLGFTDPTTETSNQQLPNTTIAIKETAQEYKDVLKGLVSKTYPKAFFTTNDINSEFDVIITIGFK